MMNDRKTKKAKKAKSTGSSIMNQGRLMPWLFIIPSLIIIFIYIAYPTIYTGYLSLRSKDSTEWAIAACRPAARAAWRVGPGRRDPGHPRAT